MNQSLDQKQKKVEKGVAFYIHMINEHPDTELESKPVGTNLSET